MSVLKSVLWLLLLTSGLNLWLRKSVLRLRRVLRLLLLRCVLRLLLLRHLVRTQLVILGLRDDENVWVPLLYELLEVTIAPDAVEAVHIRVLMLL